MIRPFVILLCLYLCFCCTAIAQTDAVSPFSRLEFPPQKDTAAIRAALKKADEIRHTDPDRALQSYKDLLAQSLLLHYSYGLVKSSMEAGNILAGKGLNERAVFYYRKAVEIIEQTNRYHKLLPVLFSNMGISYDGLGLYEQSATAFTRALDSYEQYPSAMTSQSTIILNLAGTFTKLKQYDKASYYLNSIAYQENGSPDWNLRTAALNNKGAVAALQNKLPESRRYFEQSLAVARQHNLENIEAEVNLANIYFQQKDPDKAIPVLTHIIENDKAVTEDNKIAALHLMGQIYTSRKQYTTAENYLLLALEKSSRLGIAEKVMNTELALSELYERTGKFEQSLIHKNAYLAIRDSIANKEIANNINQLETKYRTAQKDKELLQKKYQISSQENKLKKKNSWILIASSLSALLGLLFFFFYRQNRQKQLIHRKQIDVLQHRQEIEQLKAIMKGEEKERERMARELHDGIGGMLVSARLNLGSIRETYPEAVYNYKIEDVMKMLQNTSSEVRRTAHNLMPEVLTRAGLEDAIGIYCDEIGHGSNMEIDIQFQGDFSWLGKSAELLLYRIVQELVQNVVKHAGATYMAILLRHYEQSLSITVEDNGSGFELNEEHKGSGLYSMKNRVEALRGEISIMSAPGRNTTVFIVLEKDKLVSLG